MTKELEEIRKVNSNLQIENQKLTRDLESMTSSRSEADGKIRRLEGILQQTQTRLQDTERIKDEQSEKGPWFKERTVASSC